jgi:hypothetical protein
MSEPPRAKVRTTNWNEYNAALKRRGSLRVWLDPDLPWQADATGRAGRPAVFDDTAIQFPADALLHSVIADGAYAHIGLS